MIIDSNTLEDHAILEADICIIGAGAAGIAIGHEFLHTDKKVVMLESGGFTSSKVNQSFCKVESTHLKVDEASRVRAFGGTTNAWTGGWKPLDDVDFEKKDWVPLSGWPIQKTDIASYYDLAGEFVHGPTLKDYIVSEQEDGEIQSTLLRVIPKTSLHFGNTFRGFFELSHSVDVYLDATVVKICAEGNRVKQVSVKTLQGKEYVVRARQFVVACGGIENARILLASQLGNSYDQVGRCYMDHPKGVSGEIEVINQHGIEKYLEGKDSVGVFTRGLQLTPSAQKQYQVLNSYVQIRRDFSRDNIYVRVVRKLLGLNLSRSRVLIRSFMEQEPRSENRVVLSDQLDVLGNPIAKVNWSISELDMKSVRVLHEALKAYFDKNNIGIVTSPIITGTDVDRWPVKTDASHHMGTTRMGTDPKTSVVDENCKVHGLENLYVAGSSVFPTSGHANPTATIVALALRMANHLKYDILSHIVC